MSALEALIDFVFRHAEIMFSEILDFASRHPGLLFVGFLLGLALLIAYLLDNHVLKPAAHLTGDRPRTVKAK
jgi:hypothetical protein